MFFLLLIPSVSCDSAAKNGKSHTAAQPVPQAFSDYWYAGKAEITSYDLQQARYGEMRDGKAVLIFVTEDFLSDKQVKDESGHDNAVSVLKLNYVKKFNTGIYPYSLMKCIFVPVDTEGKEKPLKISASSQEWCGHTYAQLNLEGKQYRYTGHSYFENEADQEFKLPAALAEDAIFSYIRLNPSVLPTGKIKIIPDLLHSRLLHFTPGEKNAVAEMKAASDSDFQADLQCYSLTYPEENRKLEIFFRNEFPYEIEGWKETYKSGWGESAKVLTTIAKKNKRLMTEYWRQNHNANSYLRKELGLE